MNELIYIGLFLFFLFVFLYFVFKKRKKGHFQQSMDMSLFSVRMPRYDNEEERERIDRQALIGKMEQFYSNFLNIDKPNKFFRNFFYGTPRIALEIASETGKGDVSFYVAVPVSHENSLSKYVQGIFPGAVLEKKSEDYTIFEPKGFVSASYLKQQKTFYLPIGTYQELKQDPLESITNSIANITPDEGAAIQIILKPLSFDLKKNGDKILSLINNSGRTLNEAIASVHGNKIIKQIIKVIEKPKDQNLNFISEKKVDDETIESIKNKIKKPPFKVNIRLIGVAQNKQRSEEIVHNLESSFSQFSTAGNGFAPVKLKKNRRKRSFVYDFSFRNFKEERSIILNGEELSSVYHFPLSFMESPYIKWVKTKEAPPPSELPLKGSIYLGEAVYRGEKKPVYINSKNDRRRHFYVIGQTGTGKTTLLREMIRQDIENGEGVGVIDPHGDLIQDTLANIPKERIDDVVLFEPFDTENPCGLNMLEWKSPEQKDLSVSEMIAIFSSLFPPEMIGPNFEHYMRNAMLAVMADKENPGTLVEIPRIFTDDDFMNEKLSKVTDPLVRSFWLKEWKQTTGNTRSDMLGYVVSKIGRFIENETMRNIIGQSKSGFDLTEIMDNKKIFLANLSKGLTGEINSSLLGLILVSKMQMAAMARARISEDERQDFYLYVDEFQNFTTDSISSILSEARKYKLNLILAHQYVPQLKEEIKNAVIGNVGTMVSYRVGSTDAEFLENQFKPEFSRFDLSNIDNFEYIIKLLINGQVSNPFKIKAPFPVKGSIDNINQIKDLSKLKFGRPKILVEREIIERSRLGA